MRVVQVAVDQIVDMIPMRHRFMTAARAMNVTGPVAFAGMARGAGRRIRRVHGHRMLIHMITMRVIQMAVMQVIDMITVMDSRVTASGAMGVNMCAVMLVLTGHG